MCLMLLIKTLSVCQSFHFLNNEGQQLTNVSDIYTRILLVMKKKTRKKNEDHPKVLHLLTRQTPRLTYTTHMNSLTQNNHHHLLVIIVSPLKLF